MMVSPSVTIQPESIEPSYCQDRHRLHSYRDNARQLHLSGVFSAPAIVTLSGSMQDYQEWVCKQSCVITQSTGANPESRNRFVHIQCCISRYDSGYQGVSMCESVYDVYQREGILSVLLDYGLVSVEGSESKESASAWLQQSAFRLLRKWVQETLKAKMGYQYWYDIPPEYFQQWIAQHGENHKLPERYFHVPEH